MLGTLKSSNLCVEAWLTRKPRKPLGCPTSNFKYMARVAKFRAH